MRPKTLITLAISAIVMTSTASANLPAGDSWSRLDTEHFQLFSNLDESATREIGADLERLRRTLEMIFPKASFDSPLPTLLYIFKDEASFAPYSLGGGTSGYLVPHSQANFAAVMGADADEALPIVYRQYLLELINDNVPQLPLWFRTGLAELFSTFEADEKQALVGRVGGGELGIHLSGSSSPSRLMAGTPMAGGDETPLSHALVHYLMVDDMDRREKTQSWVRALDDAPDSRASLLTALGMDGGALDAALASYLAQSPLPSKSFALDGEVAAGRWMAMERHEALFHLGDLLIHSAPDRLAEATQHFEEALELAPEAARPLAGVGLAREKAGDLAAAESYYEQAIAKRPDAFRLQFLYGDVELQLLGKRRPTSAEEEARLEKAIGAFGHTTELNPGFGEGWARLGYSHNLQTKPSSGAIPALERAYEMLPDRSDVAYNLLLGYARSGKRQEASTLVSNLEARGADEGTLQRSREVLFQLDFQAAGRMVKEKRYDEAKELFSKIAAGSTDPGMKERAEQALGALGGS